MLTIEPILKQLADPISNFSFPKKCEYCGYYYNAKCRAEKCVKDADTEDSK